MRYELKYHFSKSLSAAVDRSRLGYYYVCVAARMWWTDADCSAIIYRFRFSFDALYVYTCSTSTNQCGRTILTKYIIICYHFDIENCIYIRQAFAAPDPRFRVQVPPAFSFCGELRCVSTDIRRSASSGYWWARFPRPGSDSHSIDLLSYNTPVAISSKIAIARKTIFNRCV